MRRVFFFLLACACSAQTVSDDRDLKGVDDSADSDPTTSGDPAAPAPGGDPTSKEVKYAIGTQLETTADLNLRKGPSTDDAVIHVMPLGSVVVTVNHEMSQNGFLNVKHSGSEGWASAKYLKPVPKDNGSTTDPRDEAVNKRAKPGVGFSYWWGHGRWLATGPTTSVRGSCSGSCPSCTHSGGYGADCSGYVAKIWEVPSSNNDVSDDSHPYSTFSFDGASSLWSTVSRGSLKKADALVYNSNGAGHIFLYESGDGWGSLWSYEARGCSYGIVHNLRTATSSYKGIRRTGW